MGKIPNAKASGKIKATEEIKAHHNLSIWPLQREKLVGWIHTHKKGTTALSQEEALEIGSHGIIPQILEIIWVCWTSPRATEKLAQDHHEATFMAAGVRSQGKEASAWPWVSSGGCLPEVWGVGTWCICLAWAHRSFQKSDWRKSSLHLYNLHFILDEQGVQPPYTASVERKVLLYWVLKCPDKQPVGQALSWYKLI